MISMVSRGILVKFSFMRLQKSGDTFANDVNLFTNVNNSGKEGIIEKKTGFKNTLVYYDSNAKEYAIGWTNDDNKTISAFIYKNKKITIESIN